MSHHKPQPVQPFNPHSAMDYLPVEQLRHVQLMRLTRIVGRAYEKVLPYRERMEKTGVVPQDIKGLEDIAALPFTVKTDLRDHYPFGLFASDIGEIVRLHASSGTTGKPIVVAYTKQDVDVWTSVVMRSFAGSASSSFGTNPHPRDSRYFRTFTSFLKRSSAWGPW